MSHALWWLLGAVVLGIIEIGTVDFVFLMLSGGALAGALASALGTGTLVQVGAFALVSFLLLVLARPVIKERIQASTREVATNVHALVGQQARVLTPVDRHDGRVSLDGQVWSARSREQTFPVDTLVRVEEIDGATAIVAPLTVTNKGSHS